MAGLAQMKNLRRLILRSYGAIVSMHVADGGVPSHFASQLPLHVALHDAFTEPMRRHIEKNAARGDDGNFVCSAKPRLVGGTVVEFGEQIAAAGEDVTVGS